MIDGSPRRLLVSDDSYVAAFAASAPVAVIFAIGCIAGWWFHSLRIAVTTTAIVLACFGGILWVSDRVHDFGEGDQIVGYLGIAILLGGASGLLAFVIRHACARLALSIAPHVCFGVGCGIALYVMSP